MHLCQITQSAFNMATTTALQTRKRDALFFCQVTFCFIPSPLFWFVGLLYSCSNHTECNPIFHSRLQFTNSLQALSTVYMYNFQSAFSTNHITIYTQLWHYTNHSLTELFRETASKIWLANFQYKSTMSNGAPSGTHWFLHSWICIHTKLITYHYYSTTVYSHCYIFTLQTSCRIL